MKFGSPELLKWLLLLIPLCILFIWMHRQRAARLKQLISSSFWKTIIPGHSDKRSRTRTVLRTLALLCIGLALTRPQWGSRWEEVKQRGLDILIVLDTSKSMLAEDIKPNRLKQAQWAVRDFVKKMKGDRIGLIAFAGSSFLQCPVTIDYAAFTMMLDDLYAGIIPRGGTAIEQALQTAVDSFEAGSDADRVIILITDGEDHEGDPMSMAETLKKNQIKLFCIGVGSVDGDLIPTQQGYIKDSQGQVVKSSLNEGLLEKLSSTTGGFYVRSAPGDLGLDRVYKLGIAGLKRDEQETRLAKVYEERFVWFAAAALLLLLAEGLLRPSKLLVLFLLLGATQADAANWTSAYKKGDYTNALKAVERKTAQFPDLGNYNRGNILYRMRDFDGAEKAYAEAAALTQDPTLKQKALYNRGTALLAGASSKTNALMDIAAQAAGLLEQSLDLNPADLSAKQNLEYAINTIIADRLKTATTLVTEADQMMTEFKAKNAKENYTKAKEVLAPVLADFSPDHVQAMDLIQRADQQLERLEQAVKATRASMEAAKQFIASYQYKQAADILIDEENPERKLAFDLDEKLKNEFQQLIQNNMNIIQIIYPPKQPKS